MLRNLENKCRNCAPPTALECITHCDAWKLKNELRKLRETMEDAKFMQNLFNVLKNKTRLQILTAIAKEAASMRQLCQELKKTGRLHSEATIYKVYLQPLTNLGLATETQNQYYATVFGSRLAKLLEGFADFVNFLPAHSECHEETLLTTLLSGPKTFQDLTLRVPPNIASRILKRLKNAELIKTPREQDYVFFFKSKRNPEKENFSVTERKVYNAIPEEGISAKKLAEKTGLSTRRIYVYLRRLKGKKLVFVRKTPKTYELTAKGAKLASLLQRLQELVEEIWSSSEQVIKGENA
ncbi:MAG: winged helix-turn-helix domain-containing protein [Candidatus Bathyarchaeales archaeon]